MMMAEMRYGIDSWIRALRFVLRAGLLGLVTAFVAGPVAAQMLQFELASADSQSGAAQSPPNGLNITLGALASRSQQKALTLGGSSAPYTVVGTDSRGGEPYSYLTDVNYSSSAGGQRESDERGFSSFTFSRNPGYNMPGITGIASRNGVVYLRSTGNCTAGNSFVIDGQSVTTYCAVFGPEVWTEPFEVDGGKALAFEYAASASDNYEVYAYLVRVQCADPQNPATCDYGGGKSENATDPLDTHHLILHRRGKVTDWTTATGVIPATGIYRFRFVDGAFDQTGGYALGTDFYIDPDSVVVGNAQTITFPPVGDRVLGDGAFQVSLSVSSGGVVALTSATPSRCTVADDGGGAFTVTPVSTGTCTLNANAPGGDFGGTTFIAAATVTRSFSVIPAPTAPVNTGLPTIFGTAESGSMLTSDEGTWGTGGAAITSTTYQWVQVVGGVPSDIPGATGDSFCVPSSLVGAQIRLRVSKTNSVGQTSATSSATTTIVQGGGSCDLTNALNFSAPYNADVVWGSDAVGGFDAPNRAFVSSAVAIANGRTGGHGLPDDGFFTGNANHPDVQLAAFDAPGDNATTVTQVAAISAGVTPDNYSTVHLYASSGGADPFTYAAFRLTLRYQDGTTTTTAPFAVPDWYGNVAGAGVYYLRDGMDRWDGGYQNAGNPAVFGFAAEADPGRVLTGVDITVTSLPPGVTFAFFGGVATTHVGATRATSSPALEIVATASPVAGGTASCTHHLVPSGESSTCVAFANPGYVFSHWSGDCSGATCVLSNITADRTVTANFLPRHAINVSLAPAGMGVASCSPNPVTEGDSSTCVASANPGYAFTGWSGACAGLTCVLSNVTAPASVTANFVQQHALTATAHPVAGGSASCAPNPVNDGGASTCVASANPGYAFAGWSGACMGLTCVLGNVTAPMSVTAAFVSVYSGPNPGPGTGGGGDGGGDGGGGGGGGSGGGAIEAQASGGGTGQWVFKEDETVGFVPLTGDVHSPSANAPYGYELPYGLFDFVLHLGEGGSTATVTLTYPDVLPPGTVYMKFNRATNQWYELPASQYVVSGNTITLTLRDGGIGDHDGVANSRIVDPGGPAVLADAPAPTPVPTLTEWGLLLLSGLLAVLGPRGARRAGWHGGHGA